ncbi:hypothetical protein CHOTACABRAS_176 [Bacillus phage Chotacabras]|nr:hypothetical protein CHOTACABRAS_176 [Bacillus phage Chotacabras]
MSDNQDIFTLTNKYLTYYKRGCLSVNGEPLYIVELVKEPGTALYAVVYDVHTPHPVGQGIKPKKKARKVSTKINTFSTKTLLGRIANSVIPSKKQDTWVEEPCLFIAPIVPNGISTLTGKREDGFFERERDIQRSVGGELKWERGANTGVFIGLSSITWFEDLSIPIESIVKAIIKEQQEQSDFFDLTGNNEDSSNPLSRYYKNIE